MVKFTKQELVLYDGKDGASAFIGFNGKVYDVSSSFLWQNGNHQVLHDAGCDLTDSLAEAPHGPEMLDRFPVVGILEDD
nr:MAG: cytochrome B5 [Candidatus Thorarchaeota archaeon SMTZ1-83]